MRRTTADLCRQALFAALACALLTSALSARMASRPWRTADAGFQPPVLVKSVWLDRAGPPDTAKPREWPPAAAPKFASPAKAQSVAARRPCATTPCQRLAGLGPRRPATRSDAAAIKISLVSAPAPGEAGHSFSDRLLSPVGNLRDRMFGLISSL